MTCVPSLANSWKPAPSGAVPCAPAVAKPARGVPSLPNLNSGRHPGPGLQQYAVGPGVVNDRQLVGTQRALLRFGYARACQAERGNGSTERHD
jgi:hypothetical protein